MSKIFILIILPTFFLSCAINPKSFKKKKEVTLISAHGKEHGLKETPIFYGNSIIIPKDIDWTFSNEEAVADKKNKAFVEIYSGNYSGDNFYYQDEESNEFLLASPIIEIKRFYNLTELASSISFVFEPSSDNTLLRLKPLKVKIDKSKVKLRKVDNTLDLKIRISIRAFWTNRAERIQSKKLAELDFELKNVALGEEYLLKEIDKEQYITNNDEKTINKNLGSEWFAPIPISVDKNDQYIANSLGNYAIFIEVAEIDNFGERVEKIGKGIKTLGQSIKK